MWRKALALGLVLMAIGVVIGGAVEESKVGAVLWAYHKYKHKNTRADVDMMKGGLEASVGGATIAGVGYAIASSGVAGSLAVKIGAAMFLAGSGIFFVGLGIMA
ncbi:hypothetical protein E3E22_07080 [Thermococcus sp. MV5]|uniref:hypothetical protein n=1 Tax=Thermococcus sp. MV5 TaxID=1638272 RepID=UPI00143C9450|nr:hypothetical protein [Thermococcus sp. MV5]NJE26383.1 hypothetical protein [Thermococcus sp. MV5]